MDKYNKSVQHQWFHHATWGSPERKNEGVGKVTWHSLSEDGKVEIVDIQFGNKLYKNVSVSRLNPTDESSHSHPRKKKKKMKIIYKYKHYKYIKIYINTGRYITGEV